MHHRWARAAAFGGLLAAGFGTAPAIAADPQAYAVTIAASGDAALDAALNQSSLLVSLAKSVPAPPFALIDRARGDTVRFDAAAQSLGYYKARFSLTVAGKDLNDKTLPDVLEAVPQDQTVAVAIAVERGPLYRLRKVEIEGLLPPGVDARGVMGVKPGDPADATPVLAGQAALLSALQDRGYAFARVDTPAAFADDDNDVLDVTYHVEPGAVSAIGSVGFRGLAKVDEDFARSVVSIKPGERYRPEAIEAARQKLLALGVFSNVSVPPPAAPDAKGDVPLVFDVQERLRHSVALSGSYSTDLGFSQSTSWTHRNLFGRAERLTLSASATGLGGNATAGLGYNIGAQFVVPRFLGDAQDFETAASAVKQHFDAYNQTAETFGVSLRRNFSPQWSGTAGLTFTHDDVRQEGTSRIYELFLAPITASYDSTFLKDPLADPVDGARASLSITPTVAFGDKTFVFAVLQGSGSAYFDVAGDGRSVVAVRAMAASIGGASHFDLPPDQRLYAGGSGTVRGFRYQSIGPTFADGKPTGATSFDAMSLELRQRVWGDYGMSAFVDAGQAGDGSLPFRGRIHVGAGAGFRYYTSLGAVRLDVAVPITRVPKGDAFEIYIGLGQAF